MREIGLRTYQSPNHCLFGRILPPAARSQALGTIPRRRRSCGGLHRSNHHYDRSAVHWIAEEDISIVTSRIVTHSIPGKPDLLRTRSLSKAIRRFARFPSKRQTE